MLFIKRNENFTANQKKIHFEVIDLSVGCLVWSFHLHPNRNKSTLSAYYDNELPKILRLKFPYAQKVIV